MSNYYLIKQFAKGSIKGKGSNLRIERNNLINYTTVIATRRGEVVILNGHDYSPTTGKNQAYIRRASDKVIECGCETLFNSMLNDSEEMGQVLEALDEIEGATYMYIS